MSYKDDARSDAKETIAYYKDEIVEQLLDKGEASDDLYNDYPNGDAYHHENHTDKYYDLSESADVLDELSEHEETDEGLWHGISPKEAICVQAAYTYANAVYSEFRELIEAINTDAENIIDDFNDRIADAEAARTEAEEDGDGEYDGDDPDVLLGKKNAALCDLVEEYT